MSGFVGMVRFTAAAATVGSQSGTTVSHILGDGVLTWNTGCSHPHSLGRLGANSGDFVG